MGKHLSPTAVGVFVLGGIAIAIVAIVILASGGLFQKTYSCVLFFGGDVNGLRVGAPVKFRGVQVGSVSRITLNLEQAGPRARAYQIRIPVVIALDENRVVRQGELRDPGQTLRALIKQGLRGQLAIESLVTGLSYVALDMLPNTKAHFVLPPNSRYLEIPTVPTAFEKAQSAATRLMSQLDQVDLVQLAKSTSGALDSVRQFFASPELKATMATLPDAARNFDRTAANLNRAALEIRRVASELRKQSASLAPGLRASTENAASAMKQAQKTFADLGTIVEPGSPLNYQLLQTLRQLSAAAVATRQLADYLQRNPSALVRGRSLP